VSNQVPTYYVQEFSTNVEFLVQQMDTRFWPNTNVRAQFGQGAASIEQVGLTNANVRTGRYQSLQPIDTPADRRWVYPTIIDWMDLVDNFDKLKMLIDPTGYYSQEATMALNRQKDDIWLTAFFGTAQTGQTAQNSVTFPGSQQVSVVTGSSGGATPVGMNVPKLRAARKILLQNEVDLENEGAFGGLNAVQFDDLLNQAQAISYDYQDKPVLANGKVQFFMGFRFVHSERLPVNGSGYRRNPFWVKSGMHGGMWQDIKTRISQREDLSSIPYQVYVSMVVGATRHQEKKCVEIIDSES
jgi:hypothetical protein